MTDGAGGRAVARKAPEEAAVPANDQPRDAREDILAVATEEFVSRGLSGARVDAIAERTRTTKGMIYYYFGSKAKLYIAVLERAYLSIRSAEENARIVTLPPLEAAQALVEASFDFHWRNPHVGRLISIENINDGQFARSAPRIKAENRIAITAWQTILDAGRAAGLFRHDIEAVDLHALVTSLCVFRVTNRPTFRAIFDFDFADQAVRERHRVFIVEMVLNLLLVADPAQKSRAGANAQKKRKS